MLFYTFWLNATTTPPPSSLTVLCSRVLNVLPYATSVSEIHCAAVADLSLLTLITGLPLFFVFVDISTLNSTSPVHSQQQDIFVQKKSSLAFTVSNSCIVLTHFVLNFNLRVALAL